MSTKLSETQRSTLKSHENKLRKLCLLGRLDEAEDSLNLITRSFRDQPRHFRLTKTRIVFAEALLDAGKNEKAEILLEKLLVVANPKTRLFLEIKSLVAILALRKNDLEQARKNIRFVLLNYSKLITSERKKDQFYQRLEKRIEEECILSQLIQPNSLRPRLDEIEERVVSLVQESEERIISSLASRVGPSALLDANNIQKFAHAQLTAAEQLRLPAPASEVTTATPKIGEKAFLALRRVGWKVLCNKNNATYHIWTNGLAAIFGGKEFFTSVAAFFESWEISDVEVIAAFTALAVRHGCDAFCDELKPASLIIPAAE